MKYVLTASLVLAACNGPTEVVGGLQEVAAMRSLPNRDLDLLFVIDDSPSTGDKQAAFANAFPRMIDVLSQIDGGLPNLHIGVITSDMGTSASGSVSPGAPIGQIGSGGCGGFGKDGALQQPAGVTDVYLSDVEGENGGRVRNYTGELRDVFGQLAHVGTGGCGFEQPLAAMKRSFNNPANAGFLRDTANLAVVFLQDEDDCSLKSNTFFGPEEAGLGPLQSFRCFQFGVTCAEDSGTEGPKTDCAASTDSLLVDDLGPFVDALLATKPDERMLMTAAIAGDPTPVAVELRAPPGGLAPQLAVAHSCTAQLGGAIEVADPAIRMAGFLDAFPDRSALTSICSSDLSSPLDLIGESAKKLMGDPCLDTTQLADTDPTMAGVQPSCEVAEVRDSAPDAATLLPLCSSGALACFEIVPDGATCPATADHMRVRIRRAAAAPDDSWTHVRCQLAQ